MVIVTAGKMSHRSSSLLHTSQSSPNCFADDPVRFDFDTSGQEEDASCRQRLIPVFKSMDADSRTTSNSSIHNNYSSGCPSSNGHRAAIPPHVFGHVTARKHGGILKNSNSSYLRAQLARNGHCCGQHHYPHVPRIKNLGQDPNNYLSTSLSGLPFAHPRQRLESCSSGTVPLERRFNKSCDWSPLPLDTLHSQHHNDASSLRSFNNPIAQVSTDILRVSGYSNQFRNLLTARSRRESVHGGLLQRSPSQEEKCNGDVRFDVADVETGTTGNQKRSSTVKIIRRRQSGYGIAISSDSTAKMRCRQRKMLFQKRNKVCDLSLLLAIIGLILIVIDAELTALNLIDKESFISVSLRTLCVGSTIALIVSLINYHRVEVQIALIDSGADHWRVALTTERIIKLAIEIAVCALCPFPGSGTMNWPYISPEERRVTMVSVPVDVILSVPMFLRAYLLCRFMVLHSKQFQDAATRSIAALNRISMDFRFVIKTMMADHPLTVLVIFTVSFWICMSWMFTQCERYNGRYSANHYYLNSLWFVTVSFLSIGYGDVVPSTYCGRMLAITTGIVGAGVSSALIAVISRKLELSRAEKHVNNFMADSKLTNQRKNAAASVLQQTWFIHKYQKTTATKGDDLRLRHHQRKFLNAINEFRRIKWDQRKLQERGNSLLDVGKLHNDMHETLFEMHRTQDQFISQIDILTQRIIELQNAVMSPNNAHSGPPQYSRQFSGGSTLQVPGAPPGNQDLSTTGSSTETVSVSINNNLPIQRQQAITAPHPVPNPTPRSNYTDESSEYFSVRSNGFAGDSSKSPQSPVLTHVSVNEECSPLIQHEM